MIVLSLKQGVINIHQPELKAQIMSLIAQEAIHGNAFNHFIKKLITPYYRLTSISKLRLFRGIAKLIHTICPTFHLALSAAGEHITAISAALLLSDKQWLHGVDPNIAAIWRWHCIEEIEHKTVAYDAFQACDGNYLTRITAMMLILSLFMTVYIKPIVKMAWQDKQWRRLDFYQHLWQFYFSRRGLCRQLWPRITPYFQLKFHPAQQDDSDLISSWKTYFKSRSFEEITLGLTNFTPPV
jgi:predicted metal-dependent hydrolase